MHTHAIVCAPSTANTAALETLRCTTTITRRTLSSLHVNANAIDESSCGIMRVSGSLHRYSGGVSSSKHTRQKNCEQHHYTSWGRTRHIAWEVWRPERNRVECALIFVFVWWCKKEYRGWNSDCLLCAGCLVSGKSTGYKFLSLLDVNKALDESTHATSCPFWWILSMLL